MRRVHSPERLCMESRPPDICDRLAPSKKEKGMVIIMNDSKRTCGSCSHIKGVVCDVKNCIHHDGETHCTAGEITVGPSYASSSHDTACATFEASKCGSDSCNVRQ